MRRRPSSQNGGGDRGRSHRGYRRPCDRLADLDAVALLDGGLFIQSAVDRGDVVVVEDLDGHAHQRVVAHGGHLAVANRLDLRALVGLDIDAVMGAPFLQRGVLDEFTAAVGREDLARDRQDEGGGLRLGCAFASTEGSSGLDAAAEEDEGAVDEEDEADLLPSTPTPLCAFPASSRSGKP